MSCGRIVRAARFDPAQVHDRGSVILLPRVDEERRDDDAVPLEIERGALAAPRDHTGHDIIGRRSGDGFIRSACWECGCEIAQTTSDIN